MGQLPSGSRAPVAPRAGAWIETPTVHEYIDGAGLANDPMVILFQTYSRATGQLTGNPLPQANAYEMIQRRAKAAGITTHVGTTLFARRASPLT